MADRDPGVLTAHEEVEVDTLLAARAAKAKRKKLFTALACGIAVIGAGSGAYQALVGSKHVTTDNAYVGADMAQVTSQLAAPVAEVRVQDTQQVHRGDILVRLDDTDAKIVVALAEADVARAMRHVQGLQATDAGLDAQIAARGADIARAGADVAAARAGYDKARIDLQRRETLEASGAVASSDFSQQVLQNRVVQHTLGQKPLELAILILELAQPPGIGHSCVRNSRVPRRWFRTSFRP